LVVIDASALIDLLLGFSIVEDDLHAPAVIDLEVLSALKRIEAREAFEDFLDLPIERYPHTVLVPRIWELCQNFTVHDGTYVALAEGLDVPLLTSDKRLAGAARKHTDVEVLLAA
jgi:predicted nucleic acid-binding protein